MQTDSDLIKSSLFSLKKNNPYYFCCPPMKLHSAGVAVMHRLCHMVNRMGYPAYVVIDRKFLGKLGYPRYPTQSGLVTPELTEEIAQQHYEEALTPIVVYPDTVVGNPLSAPYICRYMLNFPGFFGGESSVARDESVFSYSKKIALHTQSPDNVLFLPISDPDFFVFPTEQAERKGAYRYNQKFVHIHGGKVESSLEQLPEITRDRHDSPTKEKLRSIFQSSEYFYAFENTALSIEAALTGCPVILIPNPWFTEVIAEYELGMDGFAFGNQPEKIQRAKETVHLFRARYLKCINDIQSSLNRMIVETQDRAGSTEYRRIINTSCLPVHAGIELGSLAIPMRIFMRIGVIQNKVFVDEQWLRRLTKKIIIRTLRMVGAEKAAKSILNKTRAFYQNTCARLGEAGEFLGKKRCFGIYEREQNQLPMGAIPPHVL